MNSNRFYVYQLIDPRTDKPFYIGKGTGNRMNDHIKEARGCIDTWQNQMKCQTIISVENSGRMIIVEKIQDNMSEDDALILESSIIRQYGKLIDGSGILTNISTGGTGCCANIGGKPVQQYTMTGALIQSFISLTLAEHDTGISKSNICGALNRRIGSAGGYRWGYNGELPNMSPVASKNISVVQYDLMDNAIASYDSITEAANDNNVIYTSIVDCCKNRLITAGGHRWGYKGEMLIPVPVGYNFQSRDRKLHALDDIGTTVYIFDSAIEAAKKVGLKSSSGISDVCAGRKKKSGGYRWKWVEF